MPLNSIGNAPECNPERTLVQISTLEKRKLETLDRDLMRTNCLIGVSVTAAALLVIGSLILIGSAALVLTLPGVNAMSQVLYPALVPGFFGLLVSLPFILNSVSYVQKKNLIRRKQIKMMIGMLETYDIPKLPKKDQVQFIQTNFFKEHWWKPYRTQIILDLKKEIGEKKEERNPRQEAISRALDQITKNINKPKKS